MKNLSTISKVVIKVMANKTNRTFTLRKNNSKYRTSPMGKEEFGQALNWDR